MLIVFIVCGSSVTHTMPFNGNQWISFWLEMEPPDVERVAVGSRDHSLVLSLKECVSRKSLFRKARVLVSTFLVAFNTVA